MNCLREQCQVDVHMFGMLVVFPWNRNSHIFQEKCFLIVGYVLVLLKGLCQKSMLFLAQFFPILIKIKN